MKVGSLVQHTKDLQTTPDTGIITATAWSPTGTRIKVDWFGKYSAGWWEMRDFEVLSEGG